MSVNIIIIIIINTHYYMYIYIFYRTAKLFISGIEYWRNFVFTISKLLYFFFSELTYIHTSYCKCSHACY